MKIACTKKPINTENDKNILINMLALKQHKKDNFNIFWLYTAIELVTVC